MCGRAKLATDFSQLKIRWELGQDRPNWLRPRYNLAPTQTAAVVRLDADGARELVPMRWGLIPFWAKDEKVGFKMINARCETIATSGAFKHALKRRRALFLADGFYEWQKLDAKTKQPWLFEVMEAGAPVPFAFAALWESWKPKDGGDPIESVTIATTTPNDLQAPIHDRMPVILSREAEARWLDPATAEADAVAMLTPYPADAMRATKISARVSSVKNDDPDVIAPLAA